MHNNLIDTQLLVMPIGVVADILKVHKRTLRIYDKEGLLTPKRTSKNRRMYAYDDLEKARLILFLTRNLALNLLGAKMILGMLEEYSIKPKDYITFVQKIAKKQKINEQENIEKTKKRGRKLKS